jgi:hypothetical protein
MFLEAKSKESFLFKKFIQEKSSATIGFHKNESFPKFECPRYNY